jgi:hypothetical protein
MGGSRNAVALSGEIESVVRRIRSSSRSIRTSPRDAQTGAGLQPTAFKCWRCVSWAPRARNKLKREGAGVHQRRFGDHARETEVLRRSLPATKPLNWRTTRFQKSAAI